MPKLSAQRARDLLDYNPLTGVMVWKARDESMFEGKKKGSCARWNNRYAGKRAGALHRGAEDVLYRSVRIDNKAYLEHRVAWLIYYGRWPKDKLDHRDGNGLNNPISNLREATQKENMHNQRLRRTSSTGICGVSWRSDQNKWRAYLRTKHLGTFDTLLDAVSARKSAEIGEGFSERHGKPE